MSPETRWPEYAAIEEPPIDDGWWALMELLDAEHEAECGPQ